MSTSQLPLLLPDQPFLHPCSSHICGGGTNVSPRAGRVPGQAAKPLPALQSSTDLCRPTRLLPLALAEQPRRYGFSTTVVFPCLCREWVQGTREKASAYAQSAEEVRVQCPGQTGDLPMAPWGGTAREGEPCEKHALLPHTPAAQEAKARTLQVQALGLPTYRPTSSPTHPPPCFSCQSYEAMKRSAQNMTAHAKEAITDKGKQARALSYLVATALRVGCVQLASAPCLFAAKPRTQSGLGCADGIGTMPVEVA